MANVMDFIEENYENLLMLAIKLNGNWADGEDVLQTVAAKICANTDAWKDIKYCKSYLVTCIRNATLNLKRVKARQRFADANDPEWNKALFASDPKQEYEVVEWIASLERHLKHYDPELRNAFIAYYVDQQSLETVAASLGLSKRQTVKKFECMRTYLKRHYKHLFVQLSILMSM
jgi:RNA polymerase sigma factor (sigma-70 family)